MKGGCNHSILVRQSPPSECGWSAIVVWNEVWLCIVLLTVRPWSLTFQPANQVTSSISVPSLNTLGHSFFNCAADRQRDKQTNKQTDLKILPTPTDMVIIFAHQDSNPLQVYYIAIRHRTTRPPLPQRMLVTGMLVIIMFWFIFTCVSYAEARNSYRLDVRLSVRPSVRSSHAGTLSKRLNILSCFLHHTIAHSF